MEPDRIHHRPRHFHQTLVRRLEIEPEIKRCPDGSGDAATVCPECECTMVYRGIARLRSGTKVHHYECIHSHREIHSLSIVIAD